VKQIGGHATAACSLHRTDNTDKNTT